MDKVIDGKKIAEGIEEKVKQEVRGIEERYGITPGLATILVGEDPPSKLYIKLKHWACQRTGIKSENYKFPEETSEGEILELLDELQSRNDIHGILVQFPLPKHLDEKRIMQHINPKKDVDGFNPLNFGNLLIGNESAGFVPCTPQGIIHALGAYNIAIQGKHAVVVGHSNIVGKPIALMLLNRNATVTVCHVYTHDLKRYTSSADILVVATGVRGLIGADMVKQDAVVFDVGITWVDGHVYGDVRFEEVVPKASLISPVPGGVGPITVAMLLEHTIKATQKSVTH
ncbi:MAG: bifunctional methylenetetrahydrofolate dehydrogenase/methenyltetrahydrofolate cyclohydrolase [Methanophagales archaeon ANME-1-THS]|nr:MAG: bifunctional methylenetetrahydrofolate dehydrogenase/methenyltetrahydrofolate cyclohydrolase [Methanophagales archaeon ANME-1-THS]